jgi:hypothetical protein
MECLPPEAREALAAGGYTAVLKLAQQRRDELQREFATLTAGHELRRMTNREPEELRRTWTPEKARLNEQIAELDWQIRQWDHVAGDVAGYAANEALGWMIQPDDTPAKVTANGTVISSYGGVRYEEDDGTIVDTFTRSDQWHREHRRHVREFGDRVRTERLHNARRHRRAPAPRPRVVAVIRPRERRAAASSTTSGTDPGDSASDSEPPSRRGDLRHVSFALTAFLQAIGGTR